MEGLPMLTCLLQHTLKTLCTCSSSQDNTSNKWVYAVFWRILPRIYPPPKWDVEGGVLDRAKGNKRNWILVWEDGFCDIDECGRVGKDGSSKGGFGADIFFKLSHEVYNYGEGLIGKIAADNSHKWVFKDGSNEHDPTFITSWNASIDPTIAIISTREGIIQLGSFDKILEDLNLVLSIQRKFSYLRTIPGLFSIHRPFSTVQHSYNPLKHKTTIGSDEAQQLNGPKVNAQSIESQTHKGPIWSYSSGYINQESVRVGSYGPPLWPIPPLLPYNFGSLDHLARIRNDGVDQSVRDKISRVEDPDEEDKPSCLDPNPGFGMELGFGPKRVTQENDVKFL